MQGGSGKMMQSSLSSTAAGELSPVLCAALRPSYSTSVSSFREKAMIKSASTEGGRAESKCRAGDAVIASALWGSASLCVQAGSVVWFLVGVPMLAVE